MRPLIDLNELKQEFSSRGIRYLYHANSVETAITYFRYGSLFRRKRCEDESYPQSAQWSDDTVDKKYGIWNDLFLNLHDFHRSFKKPNKYGPILFAVDAFSLIDYLDENGIPLSVTKTQPHNWTETNESSRWRNSIDGLFTHEADTKEKKYTDGWPDFVVSPLHGELPIKLVERIVIDKHPSNESFYSQTSSIFQNCLDGHGLNIKIFKRKFCKAECKCMDSSYLEKESEAFKYATGDWESDFGSVG